ncbi:MAG: hypothetical protein HZB68_00300 [Candidatus Aenigmarchaeota archaeon]|nr:hypothetical protein [Candidatus Aenigmarchaeota archaeon]
MKKSLLRKDYIMESIKGADKYEKFVENELLPEPVEYVVVIEDTTRAELEDCLKAMEYDTDFLFKDPRGEDFSAVKGADYLFPGAEELYKSKPKSKDALGKFLDEIFAPCRERMHLKFWEIGNKFYGTAHADASIINFFWDPAGTVKKHAPLGGDSYIGKGDYQKGTKVFYFEDLADVEASEGSQEKEFLEKINRK